MTLQEIIENSQYFTDETIDINNYISVANKAISIINIECKTKFPKFTDGTTEYLAMPKDWLFSLLSPYNSYAIKMNDTSLTEAEMYLNEFYRALEQFKDNLGTLIESYDGEDPDSGVSSEYVNDTGFGGVYQIETENAINIGYFGRQDGGTW